MSKLNTFSILTIGHSTHALEEFLRLLIDAGVNAVVDVRTSPFSRYLPHFNRDSLKDRLRRSSLSYVFLGKELGGRPADKHLYTAGVADYEKMAQSPLFVNGLERVLAGARNHSIALMCSEKDPLDCHRCLLISRALARRKLAVGHILDDGTVVAHEQIEEQLLEKAGKDAGDLFSGRDERLDLAYRRRSQKAAFAENGPSA